MLKKITNNIFEKLDVVNFKENFTLLEIKYKCNNLREFSTNLSAENHVLLNKNLDIYKYKWDIYIESFEYSLSQEKFKEIDLNKNDDNDNIEIIFKIFKTGKTIVVFDDVVFETFLNSISLEDILSTLNNRTLPLTFVGDNYKLDKSFKTKNVPELSNQCNFRNYAQFPFSPDFFYIVDEVPDYLNTIFSKISLIYCLIFIFDSSEIKENKIELFISGSKSIKKTLIYPDIDLSLFDHYYKIFDWIYSEKNKLEDKIGLSRNILTSYLIKNSLEIDNSVFNSILSSHKIYIKGNISKYFETKAKIVDRIEQTVKDVNKSIDSFVTNFQKSTFVFLSFFLSVFIYKVVNKSELDKIFTKETTLLGMGFLGVSLLFLLASLLILYFEKCRLKKRYNIVKARYEDVLVEDDIKKILNGNSEFDDEINHLNTRVLIYSILWILFIVLFYFILCYTSDYY